MKVNCWSSSDSFEAELTTLIIMIKESLHRLRHTAIKQSELHIHITDRV